MKKQGGKVGQKQLAFDITERKRAEAALQVSEEKFRVLFEQLPIGVTLLDQNRNVIYANPATKKILGLSRDALLKGKYQNRRYLRPDGTPMPPEEFASMRAFREQRPVHDVETGVITESGRTIWVSVSAVPFPVAGKGVVVASVDITERKQAEEALRNRESMLQKIFDILPVGLWIADKDGKLLRGNPAGVKIWGAEPKVDPSEYGVFKGRRLPSGEEVAPDDWALVHTIRDKVTVVDELLEIDAFDGKKKTILNYTAPVLDAQGDIQGAIVVNQDITERKRAEESLRESKDQYRMLVENVGEGLGSIDPEEKFIFANAAAEYIFGVLPGGLLGRNLREFTTPKQYAVILEQTHQRRLGEKSVYEVEISRPDGEERNLLITAVPQLDSQGKLVGTFGVFRDNTERRWAEKEIQSLARFPSENPNPILRIGRDGTLLYVNQAGLRLLPDENLQVGQPVPPLMAEVALQSMNDGTLKRLDWKQNEQIFSCFVAPIVATGYANLYCHNVTDSRKAEHELRQSREQLRDLAAYLESARENERTRIARELHDELGQVLTALKIDLDWIIRRMQKDDVAGRAKTNVMRGLIDDTIDTVRRISTQLRPGLLDDMGLAAAMEWQTREFADRAGLEYKLALGEEDIVLDKELATALFRIFQETLTNVVRHAGATRIRVSLDVGPDELSLTVSDDGKGITDGQVADSKSLGLMGMRERIRPWGGIVTFQGVAGQGTTVMVRVPHYRSPSGGAP